MKVGVPTRTLEATGQYTDNHGTSTLDTTFAWDADRDTTKQIGFTAKVTSGSKTKADLLFRLPAIGKVRPWGAVLSPTISFLFKKSLI